ncbi:MAG: hypothetical protein PHR45_03185 [Muribaculaceae bacterium]|nr:hypothetical protein [Muribaculaceae bacterium]
MCALAFSTPFTFVSCKDYDSDISRIDNVDTELTKQVSALQTALDATKAEAAKKAADEAITAANSAQAQAELAKQAAADAKAAAIKEAQKLMEGVATQEDLKALASTVEGIEKDLNKLSAEVDALIKYNQALDIQLKALEEFKTLVTTKLVGI